MLQTPPPSLAALPSRAESLARLGKEEFDVLIIGGGATGLGTALEAASRGFKVALVEKNDFGSGTSSRSTNMLHGGVRYLQTALSKHVKTEMHLVKKGLHEESYIYNSAPFMVHAVPICVPIYSAKSKKLYHRILKKYDELATSTNPFPELQWATRKQLLFQFPNLALSGKEGQLQGGWVYYDGQQDDARMALLIALTAAEHGALVLNYCEVTQLTKSSEGRASGVVARDCIAALNDDANKSDDGFLNSDKSTNANERHSVSISAKVVINATGPFSDAILQLDKPGVPQVIRPAAGTHVVLPSHFSPHDMGLVVMETSDGRVLFSLPWQGHTLVGTTDRLVDVTDMPAPTMDEIDWILAELNRFLDADLQCDLSDVRSVWTGIRPLAMGTQSLTGTAGTPSKTETKGITREHLVQVSESRMITVAGGKWTTYHAMAMDVVDRAQAQGAFRVSNDEKHARGKQKVMVGADRSGAACRQKFEKVVIKLKGYYRLPQGTAEMLQRSYGTRALHVAEIGAKEAPSKIKTDKVTIDALSEERPNSTGSRASEKRRTTSKKHHHRTTTLPGHLLLPNSRLHRLQHSSKLLHPEHPYLEAQVIFAVRHEMALRVVDVLSRRTRLSQVDVLAASEVAARVTQLMGKELKWSITRMDKEMEYAARFLQTMGLELVTKHVQHPDSGCALCASKE